MASVARVRVTVRVRHGQPAWQRGSVAGGPGDRVTGGGQQSGEASGEGLPGNHKPRGYEGDIERLGKLR